MNKIENVEKTQAETNEIYGSFYIHQTEVALNVKAIQEVVNFPDKIFPMPLAPEFLLGVFNLRGMIIPIIHLGRLLKIENSQVSEGQKVAIVIHEGARVGLLFDKTSEILRVTSKDICHFDYADERSYKIVSAAIKLDGGDRILQIIDPFSLITIENIPQIIDQQKRIPGFVSHSHELVQMRKKCITFTVAGMNLGFDISGIHEIIKVSQLQHSSIQNDSFLGITNLRGQVVPVIDFSKLLRVADKRERDQNDSRIIILKIDQELFGLMVDSVESINAFSSNELMPIPLLSNERSAMFLGCVNLANVGEVFILNHQHILNNQEIIELTQGHSKMYASSNNEQITKTNKVSKQSYISFKLKHLFGVSIGDIKEIINYNEDVLSAPGLPAFVKGMLNLRGRLVTIIDTKALYKMQDDQGILPDSKILIFENEQDIYGLVVDSVENIVSVDTNKNLKVPGLLVQQIKNQFQNDIKEIVSISGEENKEAALIILNIGPVTERIRNLSAA